MNLTKLFQVFYTGCLFIVIVLTNKYNVTQYQAWLCWAVIIYLLLLVIKQTELTIIEKYEDPRKEHNEESKKYDGKE